MSKIDYQALRAKAEKATKGSYIVGHTSVNQHGNLTGVFVCQKWKGEPGGVIAECHVNCLVETDAQAYANAEFIAEANPATVLALLDERERNQQYIKRRDQNRRRRLTVANLQLAVKGEYFDAMIRGEKTEEYRLCNDYWDKRIMFREYDRLIITKGYPKRDDSSRRIDVPYSGYEIKTITHPHFGDKPVKVFAIKVNISNE